MATPQFGDPEPGRDYRDRPAAFGVLEAGGKIALVTVEKPGHAAWVDLPGGAIDPGEDDLAALVREFGEETGLAVAAGARLGNRQSLFEARRLAAAPSLKIEDDHTLVWMTPLEALARLRHQSHAWGVALFLRRRHNGA